MYTYAYDLKAFFSARKAPAYLVGGFLRDALLDRASKDVDIAVEGDAVALGRELAQEAKGTFVLLSESHGLCRIVLPEGAGVIDLASMQGGIEADLGRRDFTVDAMALPLEYGGRDGWEGKLLDPFGGREDLSRRVIRMVSGGVFQEDPARLLRAVRLSHWLGFEIEERTGRQIEQDCALVSGVSGERVRDELLLLLSANGAKEGLRLLDGLGLLCHIISELADARGVGQPKEHYWDVFDHTIEAVGAVEVVTAAGDRSGAASRVHWDGALEAHFAEPLSDGHDRRTWLKVGGLFHDIAKPQTKAVDATGRTRFLGHPEQGAEVASQRLRALRVSAKGVKAVGVMVESHLRPTMMSQGLETPSARAIHCFYRDLGETAASVLFLSLGDYMAARGPRLEEEGWGKRAELVNYVLEAWQEWPPDQRKPRLFTGEDLISELGMAPGPQFRSLLEGVDEAWAAGEIGSRDEAVDWVRRQLERVEA